MTLISLYPIHAKDISVESTNASTEINVSIPTELPIKMNRNGTNTIPKNFPIINRSKEMNFTISRIEINSSGEWRIVSPDTDMTKLKVDDKALKFGINELGKDPIYLNSDGKNGSLDTNTKLYTGETVFLIFEVERTALSKNINEPNAFNMEFTLTSERKILDKWEIGKENPTDVIATLYYDGELFFEGTGDTLAYSYYNDPPWRKYYNNVKSYRFGEGVAPTDLSYWFKSMFLLTKASPIPNTVIKMISTFESCNKLTDSPEIPESVENLSNTFYNCGKLKNIPPFPLNSKLKIMDQTYSKCINLENAPDIPKSVETLVQTFYECIALTNPPIISADGATTNMYTTFAGCTNLTTMAVTPNRVVNMNRTYTGCINLVNTTSIPPGVIIMFGTFWNCTNLQQAPIVPESVEDARNIFENCTNLTGSIEIHFYQRYSDIFKGTSTNIGTLLVVNYTDKNESIIDKIIATKSENSNIVKGILLDGNE